MAAVFLPGQFLAGGGCVLCNAVFAQILSAGEFTGASSLGAGAQVVAGPASPEFFDLG